MYCSLHSHLGSANSPRTLFEIAKIQGIKLPKKFQDFQDFQKNLLDDKIIEHEEYLKKFDLTEKIQSSSQAIEKCVFDAFCDDYVKSEITVSEIRFNPMFRNAYGDYDLDVIINSALIGMHKATLIYPIKCGIILCTDRRLSNEQHKIIAKKAIKFKSMGIIGFDCAGPYTKNLDFKELSKTYNLIKDNGIGTTIHVGETDQGDPEGELYQVLNKIKPDRIGHGIKIANNKKLLDIAIRNDVHFEICPTSNVKTGSISNYENLISVMNILHENNISFSIETDGVLFLKTNIQKEYKIIQESPSIQFNIDVIRENSFDRSFINK